jgi:hypothetical protein
MNEPKEKKKKAPMPTMKDLVDFLLATRPKYERPLYDAAPLFIADGLITHLKSNPLFVDATMNMVLRFQQRLLLKKGEMWQRVEEIAREEAREEAREFAKQGGRQ